jgi:peptidoglycan/xylan/chitin deacetylase (PgdA/CDA1 family)
MMMRQMQKAVLTLDGAVARAYLACRRERSALICFLFHSVFRDQREIDRGDVDPLDRTTVAQIRQFIDYYLCQGYRFVRPRDVLSGLNPGGRYAMLSFDDGYYNNSLVLPLLEEFKVPAVLFVSTDNVRLGKCFWWDVLYRELANRGVALAGRDQVERAMKVCTTEQIEAKLIELYGPRCFAPRGDIDRPFTPRELKEFAANPLIELGNHTANHAILTNYASDAAYRQLTDARDWLKTEIGIEPLAVAYPNGNHDRRIVDLSRRAGYKLGFTVQPMKTTVPVTSDVRRRMCLGRFMPSAYTPMLTQCRTYRSDLQLYGPLRDTMSRMMHRAARAGAR